MLELNIRYAESKDVKKLKQFDQMYKFFGKRMADQVPIILAEVDGELIAYVVYNCTELCYELDHVFVTPEFRGRQIAAMLLGLVKSKITGADDGFKRLFVECIVEDDSLARTIEQVKFLRKNGFTVIEKDGDAYLLRYERPEVSVLRITKSDRMEAYYPETYPEILEEGS